ncbi:hypothetical protein D3C85_1159470 [compost metagenome]
MRQILLDTFLVLKNKGETGSDDLHLGICSEVEHIICDSLHASVCYDDVIEFVEIWLDDTFPKWPEYSGNLVYPVPFKNMDPKDAYNNLDCWLGEYGETRIRLLDFLIEQLIIEVKIENAPPLCISQESLS